MQICQIICAVATAPPGGGVDARSVHVLKVLQNYMILGHLKAAFRRVICIWKKRNKRKRKKMIINAVMIHFSYCRLF